MKTRIVYLTHWRFPSEKTMTPLILKTCQGFLAEGYDTELWIPWRHNPGFAKQDPFSVHGIPVRFPIRRIPAIDFLRFLGSFGFVLLVASFNVAAFLMLLFGDRRRTYLYAHDVRDVLLPCMLGYPVYVEIHDFYESGMRFVNRFVFARATGLIVTNTIKRAYLHEAYSYPLERMLHQPNAVDYDFFQVQKSKEDCRTELGLPQDARIVLYTGHLFGWKGVHTLAAATPYLPKDVVVYFVGGTEEDRAALKAFVEERKYPRIEFVGHQEHVRMPLFQKAPDVLILPNTAKEAASKFETSPVKLFEYLSSGTPIVASDLPSIRDVVTDAEVKFFEADEPKRLAEAIEEVLGDRGAARERSAKAQELAKRFSWPSRAAAIAGLIRRTAA